MGLSLYMKRQIWAEAATWESTEACIKGGQQERHWGWAGWAGKRSARAAAEQQEQEPF